MVEFGYFLVLAAAAYAISQGADWLDALAERTKVLNKRIEMRNELLQMEVNAAREGYFDTNLDEIEPLTGEADGVKVPG